MSVITTALDDNAQIFTMVECTFLQSWLMTRTGPFRTWHCYTLSIFVFLYLQGLLPRSIPGMRVMEEPEVKPRVAISCS